MSEHEIWNELGNLYFNTGAHQEAIRIYQKAIALDHGTCQSYNNISTIYIQQERYPEAVRILQQGIEFLKDAGDRAILWNQLGEVYRKLEDYNHAAASYRKAAELDPANSAFQDNLAELELLRQPVDPESIPESSGESETVPEMLSALLDTFKNSEPDSPTWVFKEEQPVAPVQAQPSSQMESVPVVLGNRVLSEDSSAEVASSDDESQPEPEPEPEIEEEVSPETNLRMQSLLWLGIQHWQKGEPERALQFVKMATEQVGLPRDPLLEALCFNAIALIETNLGLIPEAIQAYQSAASLAPDRIFPWNSVGKLNCMLDRYEDALAAFREAVEHDSKDVDSWNGLGDVYHKLGRKEDAIAAYQLANVFENEDSPEDPLQSFEKTMQTRLESPQVWDEAGNIYYETGSFEEAVASYRRAIEMDPAHSISVQANLTRAEQAIEAARHLNNPPAPDTPSEAESETVDLDPILNSPAPEEPELAPVASTDSDESHSGNDIADTRKHTSAFTDREPEAPYWLFEQQPSLVDVLQPVGQSDTGQAGSARTDGKAQSAITLQPASSQLSPAGQSYSTPTVDPDPLLVQLPPRQVRQENPSLEETAPTASYQTDGETQTSLSKSAGSATSTQTEPGSIKPQGQPEPGDPAASQTLIDKQLVENDILAYLKVTEQNPTNDRAWDALGNMYEAIGLHDQAVAAFERAIAIGPHQESYYFHLGVALGYQKKYNQAIQALKKVLELNPGFLLAHCALAANYRRIGEDASAQSHIAIARQSMASESVYNRACFESISGNTDEALAFLEAALKSEQVQPAMARSDPDLDFIRSDPRFEALLQ